MISKLGFIFESYPKLIAFLEEISRTLNSRVINKDPFYYGLLNEINEYIS